MRQTDSKYGLLLLFGIIVGIACQSETTPEFPQKSPQGDLKCIMENSALQTAPGMAGEQLAILSKNTLLWTEDTVSPFWTTITRAGKTLDEPWLKVRTADNQEGWIYAGNVAPMDTTKTTEWRQKMRLQALFGKRQTTIIYAYQTDFQAVQQVDDFVHVYQNGQQLSDTLLQLLAQNGTFQERMSLPNLFWLDTLLPGYKMQVVAEGTAYHLFENYKEWLPLAKRTPGEADDAYLDVCLAVYARDSIEYFYPAWFIQTWDYGGHSLLGRGIHHDVLSKMDQLKQVTPLFDQEVQAMKKQVLQDIMQSDEGYWEKPALILAELDSILATENVILTQADKIALQTRRKMFEEAAANNILTNLKSGITNTPEQ